MAGEPPELPGVRHEYLNVGALRMHVALAGDDDAPPLLLVHGWPQHWWEWRHVIPTLAERFRVIAPDLRGFGWSEAPTGGYDKEQLASDLLALLDTLAIERVTWIGHDWGGWTGFLAALRAPERFERMLALCIPHPWVKVGLGRLAVLLSYQGTVSLPYAGERLADPMVRRMAPPTYPCISRRALRPSGRDRSSPRNRFARRMAPSFRLPRYTGSPPSPTMTSVLPPPMSMKSPLLPSSRRERATPR